MKTSVIFSAPPCREVNQLADLLYSPYEQLIQLETEHEWVTESWIATSLTSSVLAKHASLPYRWWYREGGRLVKQQELLSVPAQQHQRLYFPLLSGEQRAEFLRKKFEEIYGMVVSQALIQQTLVWQARYVPAHQVLAESIRVIQRALQRARIIDNGPLELAHIAEVIADWQNVKLSTATLGDYLSSYVVGQDEAIEALVAKHEEARVFILAGPPHSGRKRFATAYTAWLNGASRFCVLVDLSADISSYLTLIQDNPDTVFLVQNAEKYLDRLQSLLQLKARVMILLDVLDEVFSSEETLSLEAILYHRETPALKENNDSRLELLKQRLPDAILQQSVPLFFTPLSVEAKRLRIRRALVQQFTHWSSVCGVPFYFQEEVMSYLLAHWPVIDDYLSGQVFPLFQRVLANKVLEENQGLQLQLNETGSLLMVVVVDLGANISRLRVGRIGGFSGAI